jgi:TatD DNase family protein
MPRERVLPETDGPFGTLDGEVLEPADGSRVYGQLAQLWGVGQQEVAAILLSNFRQLTAFARPARALA